MLLPKALGKIPFLLFQLPVAPNIPWLSLHLSSLTSVFTWPCSLCLFQVSAFLLQGHLALGLGPTWIIQDDCLISRSLITRVNSFLPHKVTLKGSRIRMRTYFWGDHHSIHYIALLTRFVFLPYSRLKLRLGLYTLHCPQCPEQVIVQ